MNTDELIEECMDWFNFDRVHKAMVALDWKWGMDDEAAVPDLPEIRKTARKFIRAAIEQCTGKTATVGCGGFEATAHRDADGVLEGVTLKFILADWGVCTNRHAKRAGMLTFEHQAGAKCHSSITPPKKRKRKKKNEQKD